MLLKMIIFPTWSLKCIIAAQNKISSKILSIDTNFKRSHPAESNFVFDSLVIGERLSPRHEPTNSHSDLHSRFPAPRLKAKLSWRRRRKNSETFNSLERVCFVVGTETLLLVWIYFSVWLIWDGSLATVSFDHAWMEREQGYWLLGAARVWDKVKSGSRARTNWRQFQLTGGSSTRERGYFKCRLAAEKQIVKKACSKIQLLSEYLCAFLTFIAEETFAFCITLARFCQQRLDVCVDQYGIICIVLQKRERCTSIGVWIYFLHLAILREIESACATKLRQ